MSRDDLFANENLSGRFKLSYNNSDMKVYNKTVSRLDRLTMDFGKGS